MKVKSNMKNVKNHIEKLSAFMMCLLMLFSMVSPINVSAQSGDVTLTNTVYTDGEGTRIYEVGDAESVVKATRTAVNNSSEATNIMIWIGAYKDNNLVEAGATIKSVAGGASEALSCEMNLSGMKFDEIKSAVWEYNSLKPLASISRLELIPGVVSNISHLGKTVSASKDYVKAVPSLGAENVDVWNMFDNDDDRINYIRNDSNYNNPAYAQYTDRKCYNGTVWETVGTDGIYGGQMEFILMNNKSSIFMSPYVTRLIKNTNESTTDENLAKKALSFDISKDATVYIATGAKSEFIEAQGWEYEYDEKYHLYRPDTNSNYIATANDGKKYYIPYGTNAWIYNATGHIYKKHFSASEQVHVPAFACGNDASYRKMNVFVIWDDCNKESKVFNIFADGQAINGFDPDVTEYNLSVEKGNEVPTISVSATLGANAVVTQAKSFSDKATVVAGGKTYTISFNEVDPDMTLSNLMVDDVTISDFDKDKTEYTYIIERGNTTVPNVSAIPTINTYEVDIEQVTKVPGKATVTLTSPGGAKATYTINFVKSGVPGELTNVKEGGTETTAVYGVPSVGAPSVNLYSKYFSSGSTFKTEYSSYTAEDLLRDIQDSSINPSIKNPTSFAAYSDRVCRDWGFANYNYGDQMRFAFASNQSSPLIDESVTRLYKPCTDPNTEALAAKAYEFTVTKGATVYITVPQRSTYIEGLDKGWTYDGDNSSKYNLKMAGQTVVTLPKTDGSALKSNSAGTGIDIRVPNGSTQGSPYATHIGAYYKHFDAGENVEIPAYGVGDSYYKTHVFVVWDECNDDRELFGVSYELSGAKTKIAFSKDAKEYNITVPEGTTVVPKLIASATSPLKAQVTAPDSYTNGKATISLSVELDADIKTEYKFNFYVDQSAENDIRLSSVNFDGVAYAKFDTYVREYAEDLPLGDEYPTVTAAANASGATVNVTQPIDNSGLAVIKVTSQNGSYTAEYKIQFTKLDYVPAETEIMPVKDGRKSIVTIVHDDGNIDTVKYLSGEMEKNNLKTTVAMITKVVADDDGNVYENAVNQWNPYFASGRFNLANHSYTHNYWGQSDSVAEDASISSSGGSVNSTYAGMMTKEIKTSGEVLRKAFPDQRVLAFVKPGFTFPAGKPQVSEEAYDMIEKNYILMRNTGGGIDTIPPRDWYNLQSLMVMASEDPDSSNNHTAAYWTEMVDKTIEQNGWLVFLFHGIVEDSQVNNAIVSKSKTSIFLDALGDRVENGDVWCAFLDEAGMYIKEAQTATAVAKDYSEQGKVTVEVKDRMDDMIYNYPITVKTAVPAGWTNVKLVQNGRIEIIKSFVEGEKTYVYANVVPDTGEATLTEAASGEYLTELKYGETAVSDFDGTKYFYNVTLPIGTTEAPVISAACAGQTPVIEQATLTDGEGHGKVTITVDGVKITYEVHFTVDKTGTGPIVLLKLDDLREGTPVRTAFSNAIAYMDEKNIPANVGVIAVSLEDVAGSDKSAYYNEIKTYANNGHEVWNHGYYHNTAAAKAAGYTGEFGDGTYDDQMAQLLNSTKLLKDKCGIVATSFGAPGNSTNNETVNVFNDFNKTEGNTPYTTMYYGRNGIDNFLPLTDSFEFEFDDPKKEEWGNILNYKKFVAAYEAAKNKEYLIMQTHPYPWGADKTSNHYKTFKDQIDYLLRNGARFMTASQYYEFKKGSGN